jgi:hypothetical protein
MATRNLALRRRRTDGIQPERIPRQRLRERAYALYVRLGSDGSRAEECWQQAERELLEELGFSVSADRNLE